MTVRAWVLLCLCLGCDGPDTRDPPVAPPPSPPATGSPAAAPAAPRPAPRRPASAPVVAEDKPPLVELAPLGRAQGRRLCERDWPAMDEPPIETTRRCARWFIATHAYPGRDLEHALADPPRRGARPFVAMSAETLLALAGRVEAACEDGCTDAELAAADFFRENARYHYVMNESNPIAPDLEPLFRVLLAGRPLSDAEAAYDSEEPFLRVVGWLTPMTLARLRHAVYARHGCPLDAPDAEAFFYDPDPPLAREHFPALVDARDGTGLFPLPRRGACDAATLTRTDRDNLALLRRLDD